MATPVFRFAPSPNGDLHLGHALSALTNAEMAARIDGRLLLRIEDIDTERCTPAFEAAIYRDLAWLGMSWENPVRRQSEHFPDYDAALQRLIADGLVYPAAMSRAEVRGLVETAEARGEPWPRDPDGTPHYPARDRGRSPSERRRLIASRDSYSWRLDMGLAMARIKRPFTWTEFTDAAMLSTMPVYASPKRWGDVILARRDTPTSYHLSVVVDDALQGVTHVVRGMDLFHATAVQRLLQILLRLPEPSYFHHRLVLDADGRKLAKSGRSTALSTLREAGVSPLDVRRMVGLITP